MSNPYQSPQTPSPFAPTPSSGQGDGTGGLIPYKNAPALTAYYLGILFLLCCATPLPLGIVPVVLGIMGLQKRAREPEVKGSVHAWIGIILGAVSTLGSIAMIIVLVASALAS